MADTTVVLDPLDPEFVPIVLLGDEERGSLCVVAELVEVPGRRHDEQV